MVTRMFIGRFSLLSHILSLPWLLCATLNTVYFKNIQGIKSLEYLNIVQEELINNCGVNKIIEKEKVMKRDKTELY